MSRPRASRDARLAAGLVALRSPLACIALGADQLLRDAATPAARSLAETFGAAVAEIDAGLDGVLRGLLGSDLDPAFALSPDCRGAIAASWERLAPLLQGCGVTAELCLPDAPVPGDAGRLRRLATALVRDALASPRFELRLWDREAGEYGLEIAGLTADVDFQAARRLAAELGATCEEPRADAVAGGVRFALAREPGA